MDTMHHAHTNEQSETCATQPVGRAMGLLGDKWTLMLVYNLLNGPRRFGELLEALGIDYIDESEVGFCGSF